MAPVFDVLERPNDWVKQVHEATQSNGSSKLTAFRTAVWSHVSARHPGLVKDGRRNSNDRFTVEGLVVSQYLAHDHVGVFIPKAQSWDDEKIALRAAAVERLRAELSSEEIPDNAWSGLTIATHDQGNWDRMADWFHERRQIYERAIREAAVRNAVQEAHAS